MSQVPYACAVGSNMDATVCTYPDISHAVNIITRYVGHLARCIDKL